MCCMEHTHDSDPPGVGVVQSRPESFRIVWNRPESESSGVARSRSHPGSFGVVRSPRSQQSPYGVMCLWSDISCRCVFCLFLCARTSYTSRSRLDDSRRLRTIPNGSEWFRTTSDNCGRLRLRTTPSDSRQLQTTWTPGNSERLRVPPDDCDSGRLRTTPTDSGRVQLRATPTSGDSNSGRLQLRATPGDSRRLRASPGHFGRSQTTPDIAARTYLLE